jgi:hypothetical protein
LPVNVWARLLQLGLKSDFSYDVAFGPKEQMSKVKSFKWLTNALVLTAAVAGFAPVWAATVTVGDDDGFGGRICNSDCNPGASVSAIASVSPVLAPGLYLGAAGTDARSNSDGGRALGGYRYEFAFAYNTIGLSSITSATVMVQAASVGHRAANSGYGKSGFGWADVAIDNNHDGFYKAPDDSSLGPLLNVNTIPDEYSEEQVRLLSFDVSAYIPVNAVGSLYFLIDGSNEQRRKDQSSDSEFAFDKFALDFAQFNYSGTPITNPVPLPAGIWLIISALGSLFACAKCRLLS